MALNFLHQLYRALLKAETFILLGLLLSMIVIAVVQIILRNLFGGGILWGESYLRIVVLWIALFGAMIGGRETRHIAIDVFVQQLPARLKDLVQRLIFFVTSLICFITSWLAVQFVWQEYKFGDTAFAHIPAWWCESIMPLAFLIIACRYLLATFLNPNSD